jgi:hypothetical protein
MSPSVMTFPARNFKFLFEGSPQRTRNYRFCEKKISLLGISWALGVKRAGSVCPEWREVKELKTPYLFSVISQSSSSSSSSPFSGCRDLKTDCLRG